MNLDTQETKTTQDMNYHKSITDIRKMELYDLNEQELRMRCKFDEDYIKRLECKVKNLQQRIDMSIAIYESTRDIDEEFE